MKKLLFLPAAFLVLLCSCSKKDAQEDATAAAQTVLTAGFTFDHPDQVKEGIPAQLRNTSSGAVKYKWDFGNGDYSADKDPVYTFPGCGTHSV